MRSATRNDVRRAVLVALALVAILVPRQSLVAQVQDQPGPTNVSAAQVSPEVTPGGAFLRSALFPGWGHAATESYGRAGFYVATQAGSLWMLVQTVARHSVAQAALTTARQVARERAVASLDVVPRPPDDSEDEEAWAAYDEYVSAIELAVDSEPGVEERTARVESRDQQIEDWAAMSIFLVLLGATDAFVAAHLADYPEPLSLDVGPGRFGGAELSFSVPVGIGR